MNREAFLAFEVSNMKQKDRRVLQRVVDGYRDREDGQIAQRIGSSLCRAQERVEFPGWWLQSVIAIRRTSAMLTVLSAQCLPQNGRSFAAP